MDNRRGGVPAGHAAVVPRLIDPRWEPPDAVRQERVFTSLQAQAAGLSRTQVAHRLRTGVWRPLVGAGLMRAAEPVTPRAMAAAACLTWAGGVVLGSAAAAYHGAPVGEVRSVEVWRGERGARPARGLVPRRVPLRADEVVADGVVRVASRRRALLDTVAWSSLDDARNVLAWAVTRQRLTREDLQRRLVDEPGRHGNAQVRRLLDETAGGALSVAERLLVELLRRARIGGWELNVRIADGAGIIGVVDVLFRGARLVLEVDGWVAHRDRFHADRARDARLAALGYQVVRLTWHDLTKRPGQTITTIRRTLAHRLSDQPRR